MRWSHLLVVIAMTLLSMCGVRARKPPTTRQDTSPSPAMDTAAVDEPAQSADVVHQPDAGDGFCQGDNRVLCEDTLISPVWVTTERLIMDCCDGATVYFHTRGHLPYAQHLDLALRIVVAGPARCRKSLRSRGCHRGWPRGSGGPR